LFLQEASRLRSFFRRTGASPATELLLFFSSASDLTADPLGRFGTLYLSTERLFFDGLKVNKVNLNKGKMDWNGSLSWDGFFLPTRAEQNDYLSFHFIWFGISSDLDFSTTFHSFPRVLFLTIPHLDPLNKTFSSSCVCIEFLFDLVGCLDSGVGSSEP
jgi:hypothetical protein